eukprot:3038526-Rhodomonas_salina.3
MGACRGAGGAGASTAEAGPTLARQQGRAWCSGPAGPTHARVPPGESPNVTDPHWQVCVHRWLVCSLCALS